MYLDEAREIFTRLEQEYGSLTLPDDLAQSIRNFKEILEEEDD